jgi:TetR/AcrR family transcriptional regulator, transcriptional repressor for nem operon
MRKSRVETSETRRRIVEVAAENFRANGIHATGLADVMAAAGLSHGGFYRHFESKDQLVAEACDAGLTGIIDTLAASADGHNDEEGFRAIVDKYLSATHRDAPEHGCPLAGMGSELARADENTRAVASRGFDALVDMLAQRMTGQDGAADRSRAAFAFAAMIGALTLSRIIEDPAASASLLEDVRQHIEAI